MPRYIDVDEALRQLRNCKADNPCKLPNTGIWDTAMVIAIDVVRSTPSADVVERKRGEWIAKPQEWYIGDTEWMCSECKEEFCPTEMTSAEFLQMMKFCPECGADMRGEK